MIKPTYEELAVHVAVMQEALLKLLSVEHERGGSLQANGCFAYKVPETIFKAAKNAIAETPQQHLAEILAEAGRAGFVAGYNSGFADRALNRSFSPEWHASGYAHELRQGAE